MKRTKRFGFNMRGSFKSRNSKPLIILHFQFKWIITTASKACTKDYYFPHPNSFVYIKKVPSIETHAWRGNNWIIWCLSSREYAALHGLFEWRKDSNQAFYVDLWPCFQLFNSQDRLFWIIASNREAIQSADNGKPTWAVYLHVI